MRKRWLMVALFAALGVGLAVWSSSAFAHEPQPQKGGAKTAKKPVDVLAGKKVRLNLKDAPVIEAVDELVRQSGYNIQIQGDASKILKRKITLDTGETSFWQAFDQLCQKAELTEAASTSARNAARPNPKDNAPKAGQRAEGIFPGNAGMAGLPLGFEKLLQLDGGLIDGPPDINIQELQNFQNEFQQQMKQLLQQSRAQLQLIGPPKKKSPPVDPRVELQQAQRDFQAALDQMVQLQVRVQKGFGKGGKGGRQPPPVQVEDLEPRQIQVHDGKPARMPTVYAGAARLRLMAPQNRREGEAVYAVDVALEPRVVSFSATDGSHLDKATDVDGEALKANLVVSTPYYGASSQPFVEIKLPEGEFKGIGELTGKVIGQVTAPGDPLIAVPDVFNAGGKTFKGANDVAIEVISVEKKGDAEVQVKLRLEIPSRFEDSRRPFGVPVIADDKSDPYQLVDVPSQAVRRTGNQTITQDLTLIFRAHPGQGDAAQLILNSLRTVNVQMPFRFDNVPNP